MHFFIDEEGIVQNTLVAETSGHASLDEAALRVANVFRFTPALNLDKVVPVWISLPIQFPDAGSRVGRGQSASDEFFRYVRRRAHDRCDPMAHAGPQPGLTSHRSVVAAPPRSSRRIRRAR